MADFDDTPPPPPPKKRGRRPGSKNFKPTFDQQSERKRVYSLSVTTVFREGIDPQLILDYYYAILEGKNPVFEKDVETGQHRVIEDTNPNATRPTLQQKLEALKEMTNRRDGLAPQSVQIDMMLKASIQPELPPELLRAFTPKQLDYLVKALEPPKEDNSDAIDADYKMQEPSQVTEPTDSSSEG